jgi:hypothetical protein
MSALSPAVAEIGSVIQLAVAPVFLISGVGIILTVLTNRLARVVDRARLLNESAATSTPERRVEIQAQLKSMARRAKLMNRAITLSTVSALLVGMVVVTLFLGAFVRFNMALPIAALFILGMLTLLAALICFLREVLLAIAALKIGE